MLIQTRMGRFYLSDSHDSSCYTPPMAIAMTTTNDKAKNPMSRADSVIKIVISTLSAVFFIRFTLFKRSRNNHMNTTNHESENANQYIPTLFLSNGG